MGKRSKKSLKTQEDNATSVVAEKVHDVPNQKRKRAVTEVQEVAAHTNVKSKQKKLKKNQLTSNSEPNESCTVTEEINSSTDSNTEKRNNPTLESSEPDADELPVTDMTFDDNNLQLVPVRKSGKNKGKKNKQNVHVGEEEVDDGEIDKFCDELSEQDNAEYERWIQLLEAKLKPNRNI